MKDQKVYKYYNEQYYGPSQPVINRYSLEGYQLMVQYIFSSAIQYLKGKN